MGMYTLGLRLAVEPKTIPSSLRPRPQVLLSVERRNSSLDTANPSPPTPLPGGEREDCPSPLSPRGGEGLGVGGPATGLQGKRPWRERCVSPPTVRRESL